MTDYIFGLRAEASLKAIFHLLEQPNVEPQTITALLREVDRERQIHAKAIQNLALMSSLVSATDLGLRACRWWNVFAHSDTQGWVYNDPQKVLDRVNFLAKSGSLVLDGLSANGSQPSSVVRSNTGSGTPLLSRQQNSKKQKCFNYNFKHSCSYGPTCRYDHSCLHCGNVHPILRCVKPNARQTMAQIKSRLANRVNSRNRRR